MLYSLRHYLKTSENILSCNVKESEKNILDFWIYTHLYRKLIGSILGQGPCLVNWNRQTEKYGGERDILECSLVSSACSLG